METKKNILVAFVLNLCFSIFELIGGLFTNSISIISDAVHDFGDALSIGIAFFLEKKAGKAPDESYTYGYMRYSILGAFITTVILIVGSTLVIAGSIGRIISPEPVNYTGMLIFAIFGVIVNGIAAYKTHGGDSLNQKSVNLHMLEDVLGWVVVLIGAILMQFTDISLIDPIISLGVASFIAIHAFSNFKSILDLFLEKVPHDISVKKLSADLQKIAGVKDVHHLHVWSMDGEHNYATVHIVTDQKSTHKLKESIREQAKIHHVGHITIEIEESHEKCVEHDCHPKHASSAAHHHGHHHSVYSIDPATKIHLLVLSSKLASR